MSTSIWYDFSICKVALPSKEVADVLSDGKALFSEKMEKCLDDGVDIIQQ